MVKKLDGSRAIYTDSRLELAFDALVDFVDNGIVPEDEFWKRNEIARHLKKKGFSLSLPTLDMLLKIIRKMQKEEHREVMLFGSKIAVSSKKW